MLVKADATLSTVKVALVVLLPIGRKGFGIFRANHDHLCLPFDEFWVVLAQLRHMRLAEASDKGAVENQQHVRFTMKIG
jgi:hypothetical protein